MTAAVTDFRAVLHRWALAKLETSPTDHTGPFEVLAVRVDHSEPSSISSEEINVSIRFAHHGCTAYTWNGHPECTVEWWSPFGGTTNTVAMLNELLATGDA